MTKPTTGTRLAELRRLKGWTQEELAQKSGVTARTIQRIESGAVNPQAYTLRLLAESLNTDFSTLVEIPAPPTAPPLQTTIAQKPPDTNILILLHLLQLSTIIIPGGNLFGPLICWLIKKDQNPAYDIHGRAILNFQISMSILIMLFIVGMVLFFPVGFPLFGLSLLYIIIMPIVNAARASSGKKIYYPLSIPFLRKYPRPEPKEAIS